MIILYYNINVRKTHQTTTNTKNTKGEKRHEICDLQRTGNF